MPAAAAPRRPIVTVTGPSGNDLVGRMGASLSGISIVDRIGQDSDELTIRRRLMPPWPPAPQPGVKYSVEVGWSDAPARYRGTYSVQSVAFGGDPGSGYEMTITARAADLPDRLTTAGREHFDGLTLGEIAGRVGGKAGLEVVVDPELRQIAIPYRLRNGQSRIDFLTELSAEFGGSLKVAGDRILITRRGAGKSAGGHDLPVIRPRFVGGEYGHSFTVEARGKVDEAEVASLDPSTGRPAREADKAASADSASSRRTAPLIPAASAVEAKAAAAARRRETLATTITGTFELPGDPHAFAGAAVVPEGYGPDIDGADLVATEVVHEIDPASGWKTTVAVERRTDAEAEERRKERKKKRKREDDDEW